jgi:hypothetical protein
MGRILGNSLLLTALASAAFSQNQTSTVVITATPVPIPGPVVSQPMSGALPVPAPPSAALPGSGTPVGAPPELDINNARTGGTGAIVQPGVGDLQIGGQQLLPVPVQVATPEATPQNTATPQVVTPTEVVPSEEAETGNAASMPTTPTVGEAFRSPLALSVGAGQATRKMSLGEFAAQLKDKKPLTKRTFDNNDIAALNSQAPNSLRPAREDLPQSDQPPQAAPPKKDKDNTRVLDQNDLKKVQDALERSKKGYPQSNPK